jgi:hypothetical protein
LLEKIFETLCSCRLAKKSPKSLQHKLQAWTKLASQNMLSMFSPWCFRFPAAVKATHFQKYLSIPITGSFFVSVHNKPGGKKDVEPSL